VQLQWLARVQENGEIAAGAVGGHAEDPGQEGDLGGHIAARKVDRIAATFLRSCLGPPGHAA